nr:MAG TPA: hypothetical protein [Caudoviricetes sp.]
MVNPNVIRLNSAGVFFFTSFLCSTRSDTGRFTVPG